MRDRTTHKPTLPTATEPRRFGERPTLAERVEKLEAAVLRRVDEIDLTKRDERFLSAIADLLAHHRKAQSAELAAELAGELAEIVLAELTKREQGRGDKRALEDGAPRPREMAIWQIMEKTGLSYTAIHNLKKKKGVRWRQPSGPRTQLFFDANSLRQVGVKV
jgi:hypothetical protein